MKLSIVTISFNQAQYLEEAIRSVIEQDYADVEYIVVDPGSTDGSRDIIERYRSRIAHVVYERDAGPSDGLNRGFARATGDVFGYLNADDFYLPGTFRRVAERFDRNPSAGVIYGDGYFVDEQSVCLRRCLSSAFSLRAYALGSATVMQQSTFFRSEAFRQVGGFNVENKTCWDGELIFNMASHGARMLHVSEYWSAFRIHAAGITGSGRLTEQYKKDHDRIVAPVMAKYTGRQRSAAALSRVARYVRNPRLTAVRLWERLAGPPSLRVADLKGDRCE